MKTSRLELPDAHHLQAAQGWFELGDALSANEELEKITAQCRAHPDVLELRWQIFAKQQRWDVCLELADAVIKLAPESASGWIHRSFALHELKRTQEASDNLLAVADRFPKNWLIRYNLACYASCLGKLRDAWILLERAMKLGDENQIKLMALDDPDLEALWAKISEI